MLPERTPPLTQTDLARLDRFLQTASCGQDAMGLSYAHGFLTAIACGPEQLEPAEWLRLVFDEPVFASGDAAREMLGLALRLFQDIERGLQGQTEFRPVFEYLQDGGGAAQVDALRWSRGFVAGFRLFNECWTGAARAALDAPLAAIFRLAETRSAPLPAYTQLCDAVPDAARSLYRYWDAARRASTE